MQTYFITSTNEAKLYYETTFANSTPEFVVYDRDSPSGLSIITNYRSVLHEETHFFEILHARFFHHLPLNLRKFALSLWNEQPYNEDLEESEIELKEYLDNQCSTGDAFAIYFREKYIFQRNICQFNEEFLNSYNGEYAKSDKRKVTGGNI